MTISLTDHQWAAVKLASDWYRDADAHRHEFEYAFGEDTMLGKGQDFFFGGYAGTGKTTVLPAVIEEMGLSPNDVAFCAPTGKAARVMGEKLRAFGMHAVPTTIHKLIYMPRLAAADAIMSKIGNLQSQIIRVKSGEARVIVYKDAALSIEEAEKHIRNLNMELSHAMDNDEGPKFSLRPIDEFPEGKRLIVVDEGSMVGLRLARDLASFGIPILAFGDPGQLPPVQDDYGFNCEEPNAFLTEIHRQAQDNPIIRLATDARNGQALKIGDYGGGVKVVDRRDDDVTLDPDRDAMILCGTHKKRWTLTKKIRSVLGYTASGPCEDEPLLICNNSKKIPALVNGTLVTCLTEHGDLQKGVAAFNLRIKDDYDGLEYDVRCAQGLFEEHQQRKRNAYTAPSQAAFAAKRDCEHVDWGYALTVHKSQGSQWDDVVVHDESGAFREASSRWLYTAVTRAAKHLTVVV